MGIDGGKYRRWPELLGEGARAVVEGLTRQGHIVGVHYPVDEANAHPLGNQLELTFHDGGKEIFRRVESSRPDHRTDKVRGVRRRVLDGPDPQVAARHSYHDPARRIPVVP